MKPVLSSTRVASLAAVASLSLFACVASNPPPMVSRPGGPGPGPAPAGAPAGAAPATFELMIDGNPWEVAVAGGRHEMVDEYTHRIVAAGFAIDIGEWPPSDMFIQTLDEQLDELRRTDPGLTVLVEHDGGAGDFDAVVATAGGIDGTVLRSGYGTGAMCSFELDGGADWEGALAACQSLVPSTDLPDEYGEGYDDGYDPDLDEGDPWAGEIDD